jgi:tetratricopeptide (TPR) repeat protein
MNRHVPATLLALAIAYLAVTGFQCGSAEMTTARLAIQQKQFDKAEESLVRSLAKNPQDEEAWYLLGEVRYELKKYVEMTEAFDKALALSDVHRESINQYKLDVWSKQFNAGVDAFNSGRENPQKYAEANDHLLLATKVLPDSVSAYRALALSHYAVDDFAGAAAILEDALRRKPAYADGAMLLGQIHSAEAERKELANDMTGARVSYAKAAEAYEKLYKMDPKSPDNVRMLIDALARSGDEDRALSLTRDCIQADPNNRVCRYAYGVYLLQREDFPGSVEQLEKVLTLEPGVADQISEDAEYNLGVAYLNWGVSMKSEADRKAEEAGKGRREEIDQSYKEKFRMALPHLEKSSNVRSDDANLWQRLGQLYANLNMVEKSKQAFDRYDALTRNQ